MEYELSTNGVRTCSGHADGVNIQKSSSFVGRGDGRGRRVFQNRKYRVLLSGVRVDRGGVQGAAKCRPVTLLKCCARERVDITCKKINASKNERETKERTNRF